MPLFSSSPRREHYCSLGIAPRGVSFSVAKHTASPGCFDYAQHDGKKENGVIPSVVEESRGNERGGLFLILAFAAENLKHHKKTAAKN